MVRRDYLLLVAGLACWAIAAVLHHVVGEPLGADEAEYVLGARRMLEGREPIWLYTSVGPELLALPGIAISDTEFGARVLATIASFSVPLGAYALSRAVFGDRTIAAWTLAVVCGNHQMVIHNANVLTDLPATGAVLLGLAILARELTWPEGPRWAIAGAGPLLASAFYFRYGSLAVLAVIVAATLLVMWRPIVRRPLPIVALVMVAGACAVPHFYYSLKHTGQWLGVIGEAAGAVRAAPAMEQSGIGIWTYLGSNPFRFYGYAIAPLAVAGLVSGLARGWTTRWLVAIALAQVIVLGTSALGQPRYVFIGVTLLVVLGVEGVVTWVRRLAAPRRGVAIGAAIAIVVTTWIVAVVMTPIVAQSRWDRAGVYVELGDKIRRDAAGAPCSVIAAHEARITYYSGCDGVHYPIAQPPPRHHRRYVVTLPRWELDVVAVAKTLGEPQATTPDPRIAIVPANR
jgi:hypothetical protein